MDLSYAQYRHVRETDVMDESKHETKILSKPTSRKWVIQFINGNPKENLNYFNLIFNLFYLKSWVNVAHIVPVKRKFHGNQNTSTETASSNEEIMTASSLKLQQCNEVSNEMKKSAVIKFWAKLSKSASGTYRIIKEIYGDNCLSRSNVFVRHKCFFVGRDAVEDDQHNGKPISSGVPI
ncbi:hypothetical protein TNCV_4800551 [Trichonephila clavipes]|nr:hypothetical protein TNCV_4800551 [Trichonephila clavipes]